MSTTGITNITSTTGITTVGITSTTAAGGVAILARDGEPVVTRTAPPNDADDTQSRYIEAAVDGVLIATLYAPNGNPQPGPKFKYKLAWMKRLLAHAAFARWLELFDETCIELFDVRRISPHFDKKVSRAAFRGQLSV
jgi:exonuclease III